MADRLLAEPHAPFGRRRWPQLRRHATKQRNAAALQRLPLLAPLPAAGETTLILLASTLWSAAWFAYLIAYRHTLTGPPVRPVLSGKKIDPQGP